MMMRADGDLKQLGKPTETVAGVKATKYFRAAFLQRLHDATCQLLTSGSEHLEPELIWLAHSTDGHAPQ